MRFGTPAHLVFAFYGFACILLVCGSLLRAYDLLEVLRLLAPFTICCATCTTDADDENVCLVGGAATVNALTGMNIIAACFLLPIGIAVYVIFGGLRATFICDWAHTIILFIVIYLFIGHA